MMENQQDLHMLLTSHRQSMNISQPKLFFERKNKLLHELFDFTDKADHWRQFVCENEEEL